MRRTMEYDFVALTSWYYWLQHFKKLTEWEGEEGERWEIIYVLQTRLKWAYIYPLNNISTYTNMNIISETGFWNCLVWLSAFKRVMEEIKLTAFKI